MTTTLDVPTLARESGVTTHSVRRWILSGKLPATTIPKGREQQVYVVQRSAWEAFRAERGKGPLLTTPPRPSHSHIYFETNDPDDRLVKQAALMKQALNGCRASREQLRAEPFRLTYWMAVDGLK